VYHHSSRCAGPVPGKRTITSFFSPHRTVDTARVHLDTAAASQDPRAGGNPSEPEQRPAGVGSTYEGPGNLYTVPNVLAQRRRTLLPSLLKHTSVPSPGIVDSLDRDRPHICDASTECSTETAQGAEGALHRRQSSQKDAFSIMLSASRHRQPSEQHTPSTSRTLQLTVGAYCEPITAICAHSVTMWALGERECMSTEGCSSAMHGTSVCITCIHVNRGLFIRNAWHVCGHAATWPASYTCNGLQTICAISWLVQEETQRAHLDGGLELLELGQMSFLAIFKIHRRLPSRTLQLTYAHMDPLACFM
jgi:hypothetical protein